MKSPTELLKQVLTEDVRPLHRIAIDTGIRQSVLWRFVKGERGISGKTFDRLCDHFGLVLRKRSRKSIAGAA